MFAEPRPVFGRYLLRQRKQVKTYHRQTYQVGPDLRPLKIPPRVKREWRNQKKREQFCQNKEAMRPGHDMAVVGKKLNKNANTTRTGAIANVIQTMALSSQPINPSLSRGEPAKIC